MYCKRDTVIQILRGSIRYPNICQFTKIVDLTWMACIVFGFSFQAKEETREEFKEKLFTLLEERSHLLIKNEAFHIPAYFDLITPFFSADHELEKGDLSVITNMYHRLVLHEEKLVFKEALRAWYDNAWDFGTRQRRIHEKEIKGKAKSQSEIIETFGTTLCLNRETNGLLPSMAYALY